MKTKRVPAPAPVVTIPMRAKLSDGTVITVRVDAAYWEKRVSREAQ